MMGTILSVLLTILKVIGWILLILLLIILAVLLLVIFCPIRYKGKGYLKREIKDSGGGGEASWLFGLVGGGADYLDHQLQIYAKILCFRIPIGKKKEEEAGSVTEDELKALEAELNGEDEIVEVIRDEKESPADLIPSPKTEEPSVKAEGKPEDSRRTSSAAAETSLKEQNITKQDVPVASQVVELGASPASEEEAKEQNKTDKSAEKEKKEKQAKEKAPDKEKVPDKEIVPDKEKVPVSEKIRSVIGMLQEGIGGASAKLDDLLLKADMKIDEISDKLDSIEDKVSEILDLIDDQKNQKAVAHVFRALFKALGSLLPKHMYLDLDYSTGSPDTTGKIFAVVCALPSGYEQDWRLRPDFMAEKFFAEGDVEITGRIWVCRIIGPILGLLFDWNIWHLVRIVLKMVKKKKKE